MENPSYKNENVKRIYLNNMQKNRFLKIKNSLLELEKRFYRIERQRIKRQKNKN